MSDADLIQLVKDSGSARSRRRGLPDRHEVVVRPARHRQAHVRHGQFRRVRARHVQQPRARRARPAPADRGHGDRREGDRMPHGLHLHPRGVPVAGRSCCSGRSTRRTPGATSGTGIAGQRLRPRHRVAPRGRRVHLRRGDRAAQLARGSARPAAAAAAVPGRGGPVRVAHRDQQRRDADERPRHRGERAPTGSAPRAPRSRPGRRCSRSAARSSVPATTSCRWARRSACCSRSSAGACWTAGR